MNYKFNTVYLAGNDELSASRWDCEVVLSTEQESELDLNKGIFVLPPSHSPLEVVVRLGRDHDADVWPPTSPVVPNNEFWEKALNYTVQYVSDDSKLELFLTCNQFIPLKVEKLFAKPANLVYAKEYRLAYLTRLIINCEFYGVSDTQEGTVLDHLNEFVTSLILSQLEFQFPFVFSRRGRRKFLEHEQSMGSLSYSLTGNNSLIPSVIEVMANDLTSTTVFELLEVCRNYKLRAKYKDSKSELKSSKPFKRS